MFVSASMFVSCKSSSEDDDMPRVIEIEDISPAMVDENYKNGVLRTMI